MGAVRRPQYASSRADSDWRVAKAQITKSQESLAGFIFYCDKSTIPDPDRNIFGLPGRFQDSVCRIRKGMPLFLFNSTDRYFHGVFEAASNGGFNIDPQAWENTDRYKGRYGQPCSRYPAQVRVCIHEERPPLDEDRVRPILDYQDGSTFKLDLTARQVQQLLRLFGASSERELRAVGRNGWNCPIGATGFRDPESPRLTDKSDSEYFSDCSSRGMNSGEDDWLEESAGGKAHYHLEEEERLCLNQVSSTDSTTYATGHIEMPGSLDDQPTGCFYNGGEAWRESFRGAPHYSLSDHDSQRVLRLHENDSAVNSNSNTSYTHMQKGVDRPILVSGMENLLAMPMLHSQGQFPFTGNEKMILVRVQTVPCQQRETDPCATQSEATRWNNRRTSRVSAINSQKLGFNQYRSKDARYQKQHVLPDSQPLSHIPLQILQMNQLVVPFGTQGLGQWEDHGHVANGLSPMFMPSNGAVAFTQLQTGGGVDEPNEGSEAETEGHTLPEQPQQLLQSRQVRDTAFCTVY